MSTSSSAISLRISSSSLRAYCAIVIDNEFVVHNIRIIEKSSGLLVAMPSRKLTFKCYNCRFKNPIDANYCMNCGKPAQREEAQMLGYTVVDPATVVATHLSQVLKNNAEELLGHEETQQLLERLSTSAPKLVEELTPKVLPTSVTSTALPL